MIRLKYAKKNVSIHFTAFMTSSYSDYHHLLYQHYAFTVFHYGKRDTVPYSKTTTNYQTLSLLHELCQLQSGGKNNTD